MSAVQLPVKILVLGDRETGKTAYIMRLVHDRFSSHYKASTGVDFFLCEIESGEKKLRLQLWDIAGAESGSRSIAKVYFKDIFGAILVYDITRPTTFDSVLEWKKQLDEKAKLSDGEPLPVVLIGNKQDMETARADAFELEKFCNTHGFVKHFDTSAKSGFNVHQAIQCLVDSIMTHPDIFTEKFNRNAEFRPGSIVEQEPEGYCY
mmetsp:Transcript_1007/g.1446  ORF Transcript_1007/g.1446 Transcript_1007/m.1446 type:complete len:206 (+) Transcript_1007:18-635(+)